MKKLETSTLIQFYIITNSNASNKKTCLYNAIVEIKRIKEEIAYELGLPSVEVEASISTDEKQIYVDVRAHLMPPLNDTYVGRYIYRPVEL